MLVARLMQRGICTCHGSPLMRSLSHLWYMCAHFGYESCLPYMGHEIPSALSCKPVLSCKTITRGHRPEKCIIKRLTAPQCNLRASAIRGLGK